MGNQELDRKLAEWAGFVWDSYQAEGFWVAPDGYTCSRIGYTDEKDTLLPNFTQSLDACFKWLVPKLKAEYSFLLYDHVGQKRWEVSLLKQPSGQSFISVGETPALALCLAIEELIDKEGK